MFTPNAATIQVNHIMNSRLIAIFLHLPLLSACGLTEERNSGDHLKSGDTVLLNKDLTTPRGEFHLKFQHGEIKRKIRHFSNNCMIESRYKGPITYTAGPYKVTRVKYDESFFSDGGATVEYSTTFTLETPDRPDSDTNKRFTFRCQVLDNTMMRHIFPIPDLKQVMGDFMDFKLPPPTDLPTNPAEEPPKESSESSPVDESATPSDDQSSSSAATASP